VKENLDNPMRRNVMDVPGLCVAQCAAIEPATRLLLSTPEIFAVSRVLLTGCGDSYAAGKAMQYAFQTLAGIPAETVAAIDLARHMEGETLSRRGGATLVIAVSNSGGVARVGEAMERAGKYGCLTLGITGKPDSLLARVSQKTLPLNIPPFESGNGIRSYLVAMLSLALVAIRLGEVRGRYTMSAAAGFRGEICSWAKEVEKQLGQLDEQMMAIARRQKDKAMYNFVGAGPDFAAAWFGHAKIVEATGDFAHCADLEGWAHLDCFFRRLDDMFTVITVGEQSPSLGRTREVIDAIRGMEAPLCVVSDGNALGLPASDLVTLPRAPHEWLRPLFNYLPASLLAGYLCELKGEAYGRGATGRWAICGTTDLLTNSQYQVD
jgi:glucosamine--fructose-6-phosphate aminotransferase (isomerizing)